MPMKTRSSVTRIVAVLCSVGLLSCSSPTPEASGDEVEDAGTPFPPEAAPAADETKVWSPYTVEEARALRDSFRWEDTVALPEEPLAQRSPDGAEPAAVDKAALNPIAQIISSMASLYYVQIYISNPDQLREMDEMFIHWDMAPLFESEIPDEELVMPFEGDPVDGGSFVYAFMPAITYNLIRAAALLGEDTYKAMPRRTVPAEARAWDGSVKWEYLAGSLLEYSPPHTILTDAGETSLPSLLDEGVTPNGAIEKRWGRRLRKWARKTRDGVRTVVDGVRTGVGKLAKAFRPETSLTLVLKVPNRAPGFGTPKRAWEHYGYPTIGQDLAFSNTRVNVSQLGGISLFKTRTNEDGVAKVSVPRDRKTHVCVEAESGAARMESGILWPVRHCFKRFYSRDSSQTETRTVNDSEFFALAQIIDARSFATRALGHTPKKATIQTGKFADLLAVQDDSGRERAFVPCLEATKAPVSLVNVYADVLNVVLLGAGAALEFAMTTDIVLPKDAQTSRQTPVHEYGHFFFCDLLNHENGRTFNYVWSQVIKNTVPPFNDENAEITYINEGFADWFASQVVGGVNYFTLDGNATMVAGTRSEGDDSFYFTPGAPALGLAMEENVGMLPCATPAAAALHKCQKTNFSGDKQGRGVATWATLFHDIIDRQNPRGANGADIITELTSDAAMWNAVVTIDPVTLKRSASFTLKSPAPWGTVSDEASQLPANYMIDGIRAFANSNGQFGTQMSGAKLFRGIASIMKKPYNYSSAQICEVLMLHREDGKCPVNWVSDDLVPPLI